MPIWPRVRRLLIGGAKDVRDPNAFHKLSLVALLAWVGLGADGLSSSAYGPDEAYRQLGAHKGIALFLAIAMALTVFIISYGYSRIIEEFPAGGGGYVVASKLLGPRVGVVSGAALLVDYVLTITISVASGADAIFSFLPPDWASFKLPAAFVGILFLVVLNLRGVKESVTTIAPVFALFVVTHAILLVVTFATHSTDAPRVSSEIRTNLGESVRLLGIAGVLQVFVRAYSLGGGTYTGIEAVSNGVGIMREPRVKTAKRTMALMALSLATTASGILFCYLLVDARPEEGKTMNAVLLEAVASNWTLSGIHWGKGFVVLALLSEGALLVIAAQAGFLDGPRVMANMATDSWLPHRFSALSERLTMRNGVMLMGAAGLVALVYTGGDVGKLVVMYAINVFVTFTLSNVAMAKMWIQRRKSDPTWKRHLPIHLLAALLCATILSITVYEKLAEGGWVTVTITTLLVLFCLMVKRHYALVVRAIRAFDRKLPGPEEGPDAAALYDAGAPPPAGGPNPDLPVAAVFVGGYGGLGRNALRACLQMFPNHFKGIVFVSVAVVDSDVFKGTSELEALEKRTRANLESYERLAAHMGLPATSVFAVGTEVAVEAEKLATAILARYPKALVVAGQLIFEEDTAWNRFLHNETAFLIQRRLQRAGVPMIVLPVQLDLRVAKRTHYSSVAMARDVLMHRTPEPQTAARSSSD
ncbi:MAG: APC family permease [Polyangiaceae bacterium]